MARMQTRKPPKGPVMKVITSKLFIMIIFVFIIIGAMWFGTSGLSSQVQVNQAEFLENAIRRSAVQCFALEGRFPPNLAYLEDKYGLIIDRNNYAVYYESLGSNILPQIRVVMISK